ncbi:DUF6456 domain-containing protein [uncultured Brevundimonas sp.]|uniref:DUF6456 domain-containing protein n=1 Tax=uncultured Brevundimonas sp. TaxID=213418 RepID=UPI00260ABCA2|nr:DUF6456 domain-containing protein [uncultured Brevundimonas sp.]
MSTARLTERARRLMERPDAWLDETSSGYPLRLGGDRRGRVVLTLDEAAFRAMVQTPGLRRRHGGGWQARRGNSEPPSPPAGRLGQIIGERTLMQPDGRATTVTANLGESPIAWLARRKDHSGRPWLTPEEVAAGERLRQDAEVALAGPSLTMRWDGLPRSQSGAAPARIEPTDRAISASSRVEAALNAAGPRLRAMLEHVCVRGSSLQLAEQELSLRRRQGKTVLKQGLQALALHYGLTR